MSKKNKDTIGCLIISIVVVSLIIICGINERGYYWPAAEILTIPTAIFIIIERRSKWFTK